MLRWRRLQWVVIPLLVLGATDWWVSETADRLPTWYGAADRLAAQGPIGAIFVGSSRVEAAVVPQTFAASVSDGRFADRQVLNLARGNSTDAEHYLGLRNLIERHPHALEGVYVFSEAPGGVPFRTGWADAPWAFAEQPWMLVDLLRLADLPLFWRAPGLSVEDRLHVTLRTLVRPVRIFNRRERVRQQWLEQILPQLAARQIPNLRPDRDIGYDLRGPGPASSIRRDPVAVAQARQGAFQTASMLEQNQAPIRDWRGSIQEAMAQLVRRHGGQMVFIEPPLSDVFQRIYRTDMRREDIALFARQAADWQSCVLNPKFTYTDADLPDLWHLRPELAPAFSRALAHALEQQCPQAPRSERAMR